MSFSELVETKETERIDEEGWENPHQIYLEELCKGCFLDEPALFEQLRELILLAVEYSSICLLACSLGQDCKLERKLLIQVPPSLLLLTQ